MRWMVKRGLWVQALATAVILPIVAAVLAIVFTMFVLWTDSRNGVTDDPDDITPVLYAMFFAVACYIVASALVTWLAMMPGSRPAIAGLTAATPLIFILASVVVVSVPGLGWRAYAMLTCLLTLGILTASIRIALGHAANVASATERAMRNGQRLPEKSWYEAGWKPEQ